MYKITGQPGLYYKNDDIGIQVNLTDNTDTTDHTALSNIGTNTHAQIDTHITDSDIHVDHSTVNIDTAANSGLAGGGDTTATRNLVLDIDNLTVAAAVDTSVDTIAIYDDNIGATRKAIINDILDAANLDHGDLNGLGDDDHTQYLLVDGTRAMGGDLDMGSNAITNVGLVDGVDVSSHGSRHLPNGVDPLTTAAPSTNVSNSSTNTVGTANSFARSDHTHELTLTIDDISPLTTKGDIMVRDATNSIRLPVGSNGQIISANSGTSSGVEWITPVDNDTTDHTLLSNIGTNTHAQIDTHIADSDIHIDHSTVNINTNANSGLAGGGDTTVSRNITLDVDNLTVAAAVDADNDYVAIYDDSTSTTVKATIQDVLDAGISTNLSSQIITANDTITVNSNSYQVMDDMELINLPAGTYMMMFSSTMQSSQNNLQGEFAFFLAGTIIDNTRRDYFPRNSSAKNTTYTQTIVTVNGSQTVDIRWKRNSNTLTAYERSIIYIRIA